jgi:hypothetical protein
LVFEIFTVDTFEAWFTRPLRRSGACLVVCCAPPS